METKGRAVRARAKSVAAPVKDPALSEGDTIEFSMTATVKHNGRDWWVKGGASSTIRPGEDEESAKDRVASFVIDYVNEGIETVVGR